MPQDSGFDPGSIDIQSLSPGQRAALITEIMRRARRERDKAVGIATGRALTWAWRRLWCFLKWSALRPAWVSFVRRRREQIAAAQLRALSDQWLADMGLKRGEIESRVRLHRKNCETC